MRRCHACRTLILYSESLTMTTSGRISLFNSFTLLVACSSAYIILAYQTLQLLE